MVAKPLKIVCPVSITDSQWLILDSQCSPDFSDTQIVIHDALKTLDQSIREKSRIFKSPYLTKFDSCSKDDEIFDTDLQQKYVFVHSAYLKSF